MKHNVEKHEEQLKNFELQLKNMNQNINEQFSVIKDALNEQRETKIKELRHNITVSGEKALADREMTIRQWSSLHEMVDEYMNKYKQNSYVASLMTKVDRDVVVIGRLDEHGNDIE